MIIKITDSWGYPIEGFINRPFKSFFRLICQILRGNIKVQIIL